MCKCSDEELELVLAAMGGCQKSFGKLAERAEKSITGALRRLRVPENDMDDLRQDVLIRLWRSIEQFNGDSTYSTFAYRVTYNCVVNWRKQMKTRVILDLDHADAESFAEHADRFSCHLTPDRQLESEQALEEALASLEEASPDIANTVRLRVVEGLSYEEIAERTGTPIGTVRSRLFRGREAAGRYRAA
jgi:RNA polymerase sigma-70 factor (ECF subfamily)